MYSKCCKEMLINLDRNSNEPTREQNESRNIVSDRSGCFYGQGQVSQAFC